MEEHAHIIEKARQGDKDAFAVLYKTYYPRIHRYCNMNTPFALGEDIAQETFMRAWKGLPNFTQTTTGTFQAYLYRIARNILIDISRKQKEVRMDEKNDIGVDHNFVEQLEKKEKLEKIRTALAKLTEVDRNIIILRYFEDISHKECAHILEIHEGALRVRAIRALQKVKDILGIYE